MHVLFRESHGLEDTALPKDLGQSPADLVVLSFSDSDLGAFAAGWQRGRSELPSLRLANLSDLRHSLSVDTYVDATLMQARAILVRLIGGKAYWDYGVEQLAWLARRHKIALAVLAGDGRPDPELDKASTLPVATLRQLSRLCETGGEDAAQAALVLMAQAADLPAPLPCSPQTLPQTGFWHPRTGTAPVLEPNGRPLILIPFYRAWLAAADTAPIAALIAGFESRGLQAAGLFLPSLKDAAASAWLNTILPELSPAALVNATAFSGQDGQASPLDAADVPVFQIIHATNDEAAWAASDRGLSAADLAMHVALPELDGRIPAGVISFKARLPRDPDLQITLQRHQPHPALIDRAIQRVCNWIGLADEKPRAALILSTYPAKTWRMAHAVGLDVISSVAAMLEDMELEITPEAVLLGLQQTRLDWPVEAYLQALDTLPATLREALTEAHGEAGSDPSLCNGAFQFSAFWHHGQLIALQPERGKTLTREGDYHDMSHTPSHAYVAFYLWMQQVARINMIIHIGAHGTLEWLPGKAAGTGPDCWPDALSGGLPVLYPFIVSDPGEAAQARRRLGAVTLGHLPPPMAQTATPGNLVRLEQLLDEYSVADGLDPARRMRLIPQIRAEAQATGLEDDLGLHPDASPAEAITAIDSFVCDMKESQFGAGLHIWGRGCPDDHGGLTGDPLSIQAERDSLLRGAAGGRIAAGPSGSPYRGRQDVLPTGRNLYGVDPRAVPSRSAWAQGVTLAEELIRRHLQDHGDYPKGLMLNLWGSATMRTAGEDFAMALHLAGITPLWDAASERISGFEITPLTLLDRPRIEVSLRVSGLFRDTFPHLARLFEQATAALSLRDEAVDMNPYVAASPGPRVFAPARGRYGAGAMPEGFGDQARDDAATGWLAQSSYDAEGDPAAQALLDRLAATNLFVLTQDLPESDLLMAQDYAGHIGGFAAAFAQVTGREAQLYHMDSTRPDAFRARPLRDELARILRARATQPQWLDAMRRHGFRGAAEIAATLEHLAAFARLTGTVGSHLFDLYYQATLADPAILDFMQEYNPAALAAMQALFADLAEAGLWQAQSNSGHKGS